MRYSDESIDVRDRQDDGRAAATEEIHRELETGIRLRFTPRISNPECANLRDIRLFRAHAEIRLRLARTKAERKAATEYFYLVVLAESEFATGVELEN